MQHEAIKHYLKLAGVAAIGFTVFTVLGLAYCSIGWVPWEQPQATVQGVYFGFSGGYLPSFAMVFRDILKRQRVWANRRIRSLGVPIFGSSMGLFLLGWRALLRPEGIEHFNTEQQLQLLHSLAGNDDQTKLFQAYKLLPQAELLGACQVFLDNWVQYAAIAAVFAMASASLYDTIKLRKNET